MRSYVVEDLTRESADKIEEKLKALGYAGSMDSIYYVPVSDDLLTDEQREHMDECGPYMTALEIIDRLDSVELKLELLVRARGRMRCSCVAYASPEVRNSRIDWLDTLIRELDIPV